MKSVKYSHFRPFNLNESKENRAKGSGEKKQMEKKEKKLLTAWSWPTFLDFIYGKTRL